MVGDFKKDVIGRDAICLQRLRQLQSIGVRLIAWTKECNIEPGINKDSSHFFGAPYK